MAKSLTETAKAVLMKESNDSAPDRDAKKSNPNLATLRPNSKSVDSVHSNPGATAPNAPNNSVQDLGPALVKQGDVPPSAKAVSTKEDKSKPKQGAKPAEPAKSLTAMAEELEDEGAEIVAEEQELDEEIEISEELEEFIDTLVAEGYSEDEIAEAIEENFEIVEETLDEEVDFMDEYPVDMSEHVDALLAGEELSEEFKAKATAIFEAAVKQKVAEEIAVLEEAYAASLEEEVASIQEQLSTNVDDYLNYVVEQWVSDNEVAIEAGLRTELTEDFISGLRNLFAENYIDIPEDKISVVEELGNKVEELEEKLNEEIERNVALNKMLNESKANEIFLEACDGLTDTQAEKLKSLAEGIEYADANEFAQKISILRENYFSTNVNSDKVLDAVESVADGRGMIAEQLNGPMSAYVKALGKSLPK